MQIQPKMVEKYFSMWNAKIHTTTKSVKGGDDTLPNCKIKVVVCEDKKSGSNSIQTLSDSNTMTKTQSINPFAPNSILFNN